jgi:hypothetical protein
MALTLDPDDTGRRIHQLAWGGFVCLEDIAGIIEDEYLDSSTLTEADRTWIRSNAGQVAASKRAAETSWPAPTSYERLEQVFAGLRETGFIALHRAGNTRSEGLEEVRRTFFDAGGIGAGLSAFCFYHAQDVDDAVTSGRLHLAFGAIGKTSDGQREEKNAAVGRQLVQALGAAAFASTWNGDAAQRILLQVDPWLKRSPTRPATVRPR